MVESRVISLEALMHTLVRRKKLKDPETGPVVKKLWRILEKNDVIEKMPCDGWGFDYRLVNDRVDVSPDEMIDIEMALDQLGTFVSKSFGKDYSIRILVVDGGKMYGSKNNEYCEIRMRT